jgi:Tol biopolymer transport system component
VTAKLGVGGMGEVWLATDTHLGRQVAIKVLPDAFAQDAERVARFEREAKTLAALNHPNIAAIYGLEKTDGSRALVMELVEGPTLADRIARGALPVDEALPIARQIADALEAAHEQGIVHRDLKPANIKVRDDGTVKVLDFGLAKAIEPAGSARRDTANSPTITSPAMTEVGMILGTAAYMSPEQARGKPVDRKSDIWAFGCVLYEMLTGRRAFEDEDISLTLSKILQREPDWSALSLATPARIRRLVERCLTKDQRQRLQAMGEARIAIEEARSAPDGGQRAPGAFRQSRAWQVWPGWAAAAIAAAVLAWIALKPEPIPDLVQFQITAPPGAQLPLGTPALSPDGRQIAYVVRSPEGVSTLLVRNLGSLEARPLPSTEGALHPFWSPDGRSLGFWAGAAIKRVDLSGGDARQLVTTGQVWTGAWSPGGVIYFDSADGLSRVAASGGDPVTVENRRARYIVSLDDGRRLLTLGEATDSPSTIDLVTVDGPTRKTIVDAVSTGAIIGAGAGGRHYLLYLRGDTLVAHEVDQPAGRVVGEPVPIVQGVGRVGGSLHVPTMSVAGGTLAYQLGTDNAMGGQLAWVDRQGKELARLPSTASGVPIALSPNGRFVALRKNAQNGGTNLWVFDTQRGVATSLTFAGAGTDAAWSPDGERIAFARPESGVYEKETRGGGAERLLLPGPLTDVDSWSTDGRHLLITDGPGLFMVTLDGDRRRMRVGAERGQSWDGKFSPTGGYFAFTSDESGQPEVYIQAVPPATGRWPISSGGARRPNWRQDGRELYFQTSNPPAYMAVEIRPGATLEPGIPRRMFAGRSAFSFVADVDGRRFLMGFTPESGTDSPITVVLNWFRLLERARATPP